MPRSVNAVASRARRKKVLKLAKGYFGAKSTHFKMAKQAVMKSGNYAYIGRKHRKRDFRRLWITRINAAARINGMSKYRKNAVFGKAVALGRSKDKAKVDTAIKMMKDELSKEESSSNPDRKAMEDAQYNLVKFTSARQDWPAVIAAADKYRENKTYKKNLPEVLYLQGEAYLKQNELDKALINFMNITGSYKGLVKWSAPAVLAQMDTLWKRNTISQGAGKQPSDRYVAWKAGNQYVQLLDTPTNRKKMTAEDSALVNEVKDKTAKFGSDPAVSQERADIAAYEAAIRAAKGQK